MDRLVAPYKKGFNRIAWNLTKRLNNHLSSGSSRGGYVPSLRVSPGNTHLMFLLILMEMSVKLEANILMLRELGQVIWLTLIQII